MRLLIGLAILAAILVGGCDESLGRYFAVRNDTSQELYVARVDEDGVTRMLGPSLLPGDESIFLVPGDGFLYRNGCTVRDLLAVDTLFREVARRKPPVCIKDLWVIEGSAPSSS